MKQLKRSECAVLSLVLKGRWFDMIALGEKREEYRDREIWDKRIMKWFRRFIQNPEITNLVIAFQREHLKPSIWFEINGLCTEKDIRTKHPEWGEPQTPHYIISLGERVELVD